VSRAGQSRQRRDGAAPREPPEPVARASIQRWVHWLVPVLIALVTFAAFLPALHNQFVNWDDDENLLNNPRYRGLGWTQLRWMWTTHMGHYIPLTWMTFGLDYLLWGMNPLGYHLTSLLLHAANAVVFFFIVRRLLTRALSSPSERGYALAVCAGVAALVFAIHPLRVESVAWVTERRDVLSGLFYLVTILLYLRACERGERGRRGYWLSVTAFALALLSKSMVVNLPVVLLTLDVYPLRRLGGAVGWRSESARRVYVEKIPFVLLAAAASAIALMAQLSHDTMVSVVRLSALGRLAVSVYGVSFYLWKTVAPVNLSPLYELPPTVNPWAPPFLLSYGLVLAITAIVLALRRRVPGLPAAWVAYIVVLLPVLGIFQSGPQIAADRYTYLAGLGWAIFVGAGLLSCWRSSRRSKTGTPAAWLLAGLALCVVVGLGVLTWNQAQVWHDSQKLWTHALAIDPQSSLAANNLGIVLAQQAEAIEHFEQALRIKPDYADAHNNLGAALVQRGKLAEAIEHLQQALKIRPGNADAHYNWGVALAQQGKPAEAIEHFEQALKINPHGADAHSHWGVALAQQGRLAEAIEHFEQAAQINPHDADAHYHWGVALAQQGKAPEAVEHYRQALEIKPDYAEALNNWGLALARQGKAAEAVEHYRQALKIKPDFAAALTNWGNTLARQGKPAEAIEHYRQALEIKPDFADAHNNWGNALALQGKSAEAVEHYQRALNLRPSFAEAQSNLINALQRLGTGKPEAVPSWKAKKAEKGRDPDQ